MAHILVVDDDADILKFVQKLLESSGHVVECCLNAHDAMDKWATESYDLVLSDANMPHVNGFDLVRTLSQHARSMGTAVAFLTARRDKKDIERGLAAGADDYMIKPIDPDIFLGKVENLLSLNAAKKNEITFSESSIRISAEWSVPTEISHLSEQGLTLHSHIHGVKNSKIKVNSSLFGLIGIEPPILRVLESIEDTSGSQKFFTKTSFVGLTDAELQKIRFWINSNSSRFKKTGGKAA